MEIIFYILVFSLIFTQIFFIFNLYQYYMRNNYAYDVWNFFSKSMGYNKVVNEIVYNKKNNHQIEARLVKYCYWLVGLLLSLTIWCGALI